MKLLKTSFFTALSTFIKLVSGFVVGKIIAIYIGPNGIALLGQLQNFITIAQHLSCGAITAGVVKYTSEYKNDVTKLSRMHTCALFICIISSIISAVAILLFSKQLSEFLLKTPDYSSIFVIFSFTLIFFGLNSILISILNGFKEVKKYVVIHIASSLTGLALTAGLVVFMGVYGALLSCVLAQSLVFFVTLIFTVKSNWFNINNFMAGLNTKYFKKLGKYSLMAIISAILAPIAQIIVRNHIAENLSMDTAGHWQGVWKICELYLMVITTSLAVYYLPRLSEIKVNYELKKEILSGYKIITPIIIVLALLVYLLKDYIILILFSKEFLPMAALFKFQLIGSIFKILAWLLSFVMVAKAMMKKYIVTEVIFSISFILLNFYFVKEFGAIGATQAYAANYFLYFIVMFFLFRNILFLRGTQHATE